MTMEFRGMNKQKIVFLLHLRCNTCTGTLVQLIVFILAPGFGNLNNFSARG